ncbi:diguanylate cyclase with PAS/PAC sensor [Magnetococcus marinus MC-1]|uniref:Diguanylate cyclase with PAS/PAC sensor n=1 Tax=Magnetococcus marinus (strain ATCC BAA-1437 / JCM 17883 / MC-1) TaxID=156889 RepID=A0L427_MAGMM|nr:PAS domain S-box protein [Magnetococcus marinus]ABK42720.1 diguanylate cyclase with PAS/PAC sensor [Magnetococcus marinus MC-1]
MECPPYRLSLSKRFGLVIGMALLVVALLLGTMLAQGMDRNFEQQLQHLHELHLNRLAQQLRQYIQSRLTVLADMAANPLTIQGVLQPETSLLNTIDWLQNSRLIGESFPLILMDYQGQILHQTVGDEQPAPTAVRAVLGGKQTQIQYLEGDHLNGDHQLWLITPVRWQASIEGALAVRIPLQHISPLTAQQGHFNHDGIRLWQGNRLLFSQGQMENGYSSRKILGELGLTIELVMDQKPLIKARSKLFRETLIVGILLLLLLSVTLYYWGQKRLVRPLMALSRQVDAVTKGDDPAPPMGTKMGTTIVEIIQLGEKFDHMHKEITATRRHLESLVNERTQALQIELQERTRTAAELRLLNDLQEAILESADAMIIATDAAGTVIKFNKAAQHKLGYADHEVIYRLTLDAFHDPMELQHRHLPVTEGDTQNLSIPLQTLFSRAAQNRTDEREWRYRRQDGTTFPVRLSITQVWDVESNNRRGFLVVGMDITELKSFQQALLRNQANLAHAQAIAHLGSWQWELENGRMHWSDETFRIFGEPLQSFEPTFEDILSRTHPQDMKSLEQMVTRALANPEIPFEMEARLRRANGDLRSVVMLGEVTYDQNRKPIRVSGTVQDITERKKAEDSLQLAKQIIECTSEAIVITDAQGIITDINPAYEEITGYSRGEVIGQSPAITQSGRHDPTFYQQLWHLLQQTGHWEGEMWDRRKNGELFPKWLTINALHNLYGQVSHYVGIFLDITKQRGEIERSKQNVFYDPLTKLPNRILFQDRLEHILAVAAHKQERIGLFFIDLDHFKQVNINIGHDVGDLLLVEVGKRLRRHLPPSDTVAHLVGDKFAIILPHSRTRTELAQLAETILHLFDESFLIRDHNLSIGCTIGIAVSPADGTVYPELARNSNTALYRTKGLTRGRFAFYSEEISSSPMP